MFLFSLFKYINNAFNIYTFNNLGSYFSKTWSKEKLKSLQQNITP